ncbi:MAG: hypothetical protein HOK54_16825 [Alphaproteobacteria bacterium]|jgi:hypothetical protein|nr:hypothetical protein [Alphaproteobacteria bacterium]
MNTKRFAISAFVLFIFTFASDFLLHGMLLQETYKATAILWRPDAEFESVMWIMTLTQLLFVVVFIFIFTRNYEGKGIGEGVRYGFYIGLLLAILDVQKYVYTPVDFTLPLTWAIGKILWGILAGVIISLLYKEETIA